MDLLDSCKILSENGYVMYATEGTQKFLAENGIQSTMVSWPDEDNSNENIMSLLQEHKVDLVINIPKNHTRRELTNGYKIRRASIDHNIPLMTNARLAGAFIKAFCSTNPEEVQIKSWQEY